MGASEIQELVVSVRPDGIDETTDQLEDQRQEFEETTDTLATESAALTKFSKRWAGAGLVFGTAFGALVSAISKRMPILEENAATMDIVMTTLALKMDQEVRPAMSNFNREMLEVNDQMAESEGAFEAFKILVTDTGVESNTTAERIDSMGGALDGLKTPQVDLSGWIEGLQQDITDFTKDAPKRFQEFAADVRFAFDVMRVGITTAAETAWELVANIFKMKVNDVIDITETGVNEIIGAWNQIPGQNIAPVSLNRLETRTRGEIMATGQRRLQRGLQRARGRRTAAQIRIDEMFKEMIGHEPSEPKLVIDGKEVAVSLPNRQATGILNRGRTG